MIAADARDPRQAGSTARGAAVVYNCLAPACTAVA